jgi:hypothetical protein
MSTPSPYSTVLIQKLIVAQLLQKFFVFYGTRIFINMSLLYKDIKFFP